MSTPAAANECGIGLLAGMIPAQVTISSADHKFAAIDSSLALVSAASGYARILYAAGTSGSQWCLLSIGGGGGVTGALTDWRVNKTTHKFQVKIDGGDWQDVADDETSGGTLDEDGPTAGADGAEGADGADGADGAQGPQGETGPAGATGATGATGAQGPQGPAGADGADGAAGADGADGAGFNNGTNDGDIAVWANGAWSTPSAGTPSDKDMLRWDNTNKKYIKVKPDHSLEIDANAVLHLKGDEASPGNTKVYGTNGSGDRAWLSTALVTAET
jgi:hypothetical protein